MNATPTYRFRAIARTPNLTCPDCGAKAVQHRNGPVNEVADQSEFHCTGKKCAFFCYCGPKISAPDLRRVNRLVKANRGAFLNEEGEVMM